MAAIRAIDDQSIHRIQAGQVIVDLTSVVKELVENSLDAGATIIDIRLKNSGIDSIEVQDNGNGIAPESYEALALKHHTSKLSDYGDLDSLQTFGFRGEALSSLCAVSRLHVVTAREGDAPKGTRLDFDFSGKLKGTSLVASQKGTTVFVENLFYNLPVRRKELEKNIKREYVRMLAVLQSYACISTGIRLSASNQGVKAKKQVIFSTNANSSTRDNIANVYGAKILSSLIPLNVCFRLQPSKPALRFAQASTTDNSSAIEVKVTGHISRPAMDGGRQAPDRQLFFVNSRPCALPQAAKAINEVYRAYNATQSPFIFANIELDTSAYDVNVSPDKRTILLHDQAALLENLKESLTQLFRETDHRIPHSRLGDRQLPDHKPPTISTEPTQDGGGPLSALAGGSAQGVLILSAHGNRNDEGSSSPLFSSADASLNTTDTTGRYACLTSERREGPTEADHKASAESIHTWKQTHTRAVRGQDLSNARASQDGKTLDIPAFRFMGTAATPPRAQSFNTHTAGGQREKEKEKWKEGQKEEKKEGEKAKAKEEKGGQGKKGRRAVPGTLQNAYDRMRPKQTPEEIATVTIGDTTITSVLGSNAYKKRKIEAGGESKGTASTAASRSFRSNMLALTTIGMQSDEAERTQPRPSAEETVSEPGTSSTDDRGGIVEQSEDVHSEMPASVGTELRIGTGAEVRNASEGEASECEITGSERQGPNEETRVKRLIETAEEALTKLTADYSKRASSVLKSLKRKDSTLQLVSYLNASLTSIRRHMSKLSTFGRSCHDGQGEKAREAGSRLDLESTEEQLSLTVSKDDFARMRIVGQFNLGFILAIRSGARWEYNERSYKHAQDEIFIIDQHASDEKYNFERLQATTIVQNQRLVQPRLLSLTAIEEETILANLNAVERNGFQINFDTSSNSKVGQRCQLVSLPMSREVVFDTMDLEELLALLSEAAPGQEIPRPGKVRRMFAMRACRSSIMIGKTLTKKQMKNVVKHMGELDKPWNCPHGRPTMRHLFGLQGWSGWEEEHKPVMFGRTLNSNLTNWNAYLNSTAGEISGLGQIDGELASMSD